MKRKPIDLPPRVLTPREQNRILCRRDLAAINVILGKQQLSIEDRRDLAQDILAGLVAKITLSELDSANIAMPSDDRDD